MEIITMPRGTRRLLSMKVIQNSEKGCLADNTVVHFPEFVGFFFVVVVL